jgi:nucleotide-binding universal stress UspA family protein
VYKKILVPLDGSHLAECVLPHARSIAKGDSEAEITLLYVVEALDVPMSSSEFKRKIEAEAVAAAKEYLAEKAQPLSAMSHVNTQVIVGKPADTIASYAKKMEADLIVMATHGRSGIQRLLLGSVADKLIRTSGTEILLVRAPGCET